jgi:hypothetical protein
MIHGIVPGCAGSGKGQQRRVPTTRLLLVLLVGLVLPAIAVAAIGKNSCIPPSDLTPACADNTGNIENNSCNGAFACERNSGAVGNESCVGERACSFNAGTVENNACNGFFACFNQDDVDVSIGNGSCNGTLACDLLTAAV